MSDVQYVNDVDVHYDLGKWYIFYVRHKTKTACNNFIRHTFIHYRYGSAIQCSSFEFLFTFPFLHVDVRTYLLMRALQPIIR